MNAQQRARRLAATLLTLWMVAAVTGAGKDDSYRAEIERWRKDREEALKADNSWLTVAGLFWLREGENSFGADPGNDFILPEGSAPAFIGVFEFHNGKTSVRINEGVTATLNGKPIRTAELRPGAVDTIALGSLSMFVHKSGDRFAIRLRDLNSKIRKEFTGLRWFPVNEKYKIVGRWVPYPEKKTIQVPNILGDTEIYTASGEVEFTLDGQQTRMQAFDSGPGRLFVVFRDLTSGKETYPSARFLIGEGPADGKVIFDFNKAYNPPCAFNPYTTCPLPPLQNRLRVRVEAGELDYHKKST